MIRMHEKATKFLNDVQKKKINFVSKAESTSGREKVKKDLLVHNTDLSSNNCCYCEKIFISPRFLLKHILRRHPENLISLHKKSLKSEARNINESKSVLEVLQEEFSVLRKELQIVKEAVVNKVIPDDHGDMFKENEASVSSEQHDVQQPFISDNKCKNPGNCTVDDAGLNENEGVKDKVLQLETNIQYLQNKFEELTAIVKNEIVLKEDIHNLITANEDKIFKVQEAQLVELRNNLLEDMHTILSNELHNNGQWKLRFSELKQDFQKLDHAVDLLREQIHSPEYVKAMEKKLERHILPFLGSTGRHRDSKQRKSKYNNVSLSAQKNTPKKVTKMSRSNKSERSTEINEYLRNKHEEDLSHLNTNELSVIIAEKMFHFGISPTTTKISCSEYEEKMKLINSEKEHNEKQFPRFSNIFDQVDAYADKKARSRLRKIKSRKIRFSEPIVINKNEFPHSESSHDNYLNKTHPVLNGEHRNLSNSGGSGDAIWNFKEKQYTSKKQLESTPVKEFVAYAPIGDGLTSHIESVKYLNEDSLSNCSLPFNLSKKTDLSLNNALEKTDISNDSIVTASEPFTVPIKSRFEEKCDDHLVDDDLKSLSSWESDENVS